MCTGSAVFLYFKGFIGIAAFKVFPEKEIALKGHITVRRTFFGNGNRAGVKVDVAFIFLTDRNVGVSMQEDISLFNRRQVFIVEVMAVSGKDKLFT